MDEFVYFMREPGPRESIRDYRPSGVARLAQPLSERHRVGGQRILQALDAELARVPSGEDARHRGTGPGARRRRAREARARRGQGGDPWRERIRRGVTGIREIDQIGADHAMWTFDYPHPESTLGESRRILKEIYDVMPEADASMIAGGTAAKVWKIEDVAARVPSACRSGRWRSRRKVSAVSIARSVYFG